METRLAVEGGSWGATREQGQQAKGARGCKRDKRVQKGRREAGAGARADGGEGRTAQGRRMKRVSPHNWETSAPAISVQSLSESSVRDLGSNELLAFHYFARNIVNMFTLLDLRVSSLRRGHANLLCIVPISTDDPQRESKLSTILIMHPLRKSCLL